MKYTQQTFILLIKKKTREGIFAPDKISSWQWRLKDHWPTKGCDFNSNEGKDSNWYVRSSHLDQDIVLIFIKGHRINLLVKFGKLVQDCCQNRVLFLLIDYLKPASLRNPNLFTTQPNTKNMEGWNCGGLTTAHI